MQIFTPSQVRSEAEKRTATDVSRAKTIASITDELVKSKNEAEKLFEETMERQRKESEVWFEENVSRKNLLLKEVEILEKRRKEALMPPLIKAKDIHSVQEKLWALKLEVDHQTAQNEEEARLLMRKLDEASSHEQSLDEREKRVKRMERASETQRNQVAQQLKQFNLQLADFYKRTEDKETEFAYRQSELDAQANLQRDKEAGFVEREQEIQASHRLLADQRILLEKGFLELKNKQHHG